MTIGSTAIWRVRPSGSNTNGGGYDPGISGAATDYSQQNAAQASGTHGVTTGTTTFTDSTAAAFTAAMIGNAVYITGSGQTTGWYFVTAYTSASAVTLDRSPGTGSGATWALGGGWADPWTNGSTPVAGNIVYILGSGTPNPSSYTFDYTASGIKTIAGGSNSAGNVTYANDPNTPGYKAAPDTTGGMPCLSIESFQCGNFGTFKGLWLVSNTGYQYGLIDCNDGLGFLFSGCVFDQNGHDSTCIGRFNGGDAVGCEMFSSGGGSGGSYYGIWFAGSQQPPQAYGCNVHDCVGYGMSTASNTPSMIASNCIVAKCGTAGIYAAAGNPNSVKINNCTIDGNAGNGITLYGNQALVQCIVFNNIISNHTGVSAYGLSMANGTSAQNNAQVGLIDYNVYYNNTANYNAISAGSHDTAEGTNPYKGQSTENYTLA